MRRKLPIFSLLILFFYYGCGTSKTISKVPISTYNITYKVINNSSFKHLDASYLDNYKKGVRIKDIVQPQVEVPIGLVTDGFIASISCTGYGAKDSLASIELQIFQNGDMVVSNVVYGLNPSLAVSYVVE